MGAIVKNVLLSGLMVIGATVVTSVLAGVLMLSIGSLDDQIPNEPGLLALGVMVTALMAAAFGIFFCFVTLFFAALTMPPAVMLTRWLQLPRPAMDIIGGGAVALMCAMSGIGIFEHDKFAGMVSGENAQIIATTALVCGCFLGYLRHKVLVESGFAAVGEPALAV